MAERFTDLAYILHKRAYKESSYIIEFFTREQGVVSAIAKGAKSSKSKFYLDLQLFSCLEASFTGKTDLMTLTQADVVRATRISSQKNIFCGYYVNELVLRLLHKYDQHTELFQHYDELIQALSTNAVPEPLLRIFEKDLLTEIGYGLDFASTVDGQSIVDGHYYMVSPESGIIEVEADRASELLVRGKTLNDIAMENFSDSISLRESKQLMRRLLQYHLGGKPLKTRDLFLQTAGN